ncbi:MAG: heme biosynthesis HemY N-terminal domain-containing protein [Alphaproteobacteria bacterium]
MKWLRRFVSFLKIGVCAAVVIYLIKYPGQVQLDWFGYRLQVSVVFFLAVLFVALGLVVFFIKIVKGLWSFPQRWAKCRQKKRRKSGEKALLESLSAIAGGELEEANKQARIALKNLPEQPLSAVVAAQAAFMCGKTDEALKCFQLLQQTPHTRFLGLRGEALQALRQGDWSTAQIALRQAATLRPDSPWALKHLFEADLRLGSYDRSEAVLKQLQTRKVIDAVQQRRYQALVYWLKAQAAKLAHDPSRFSHYIKKAHDMAPELVAVAAQYAAYEIENDAAKHAKKILAATWFYQPHPDLVVLFKKIATDKSPLDFYRYLAGVALADTNNVDANVILAEVAIAAKLWGQARRHLHDVHQTQETQASCRLMAKLIRGESPHDENAARTWEQKALSVSPGSVWVCHQCHGQQAAWEVFCTHCGGLDTVTWSLPQATGAVKALLPQLI